MATLPPSRHAATRRPAFIDLLGIIVILVLFAALFLAVSGSFARMWHYIQDGAVLVWEHAVRLWERVAEFLRTAFAP